MTIEEVKTCNKCHDPKKLTEFSKDKYKDDGHNARCKVCINGIAKVSRQMAREKKRLGIVPVEKVLVTKNGKILCNRNGEYITKASCLPGCNDACIPCDNKQMQNIGAGSDTLTPEEDKEAMIAGTYGSSSAIAVDEGHCEI